MFNKVMVAGIVGAILTLVRVFFPDLDIPAGFEAAIVTIIMTLVGWFTPENAAKLQRYLAQNR